MNLKLLKKQVTIKMISCTTILASSLIILCYLHHYNSKLCNDNSYLTGKIEIMNQKVTKIHKREMILNNNFVLWKEISLSNLYSNNSYIYNLDLLINRLCEKYKILKPEINISAPIIIDNNYRKKHIEVVKNQIDIKFSSISDEHVFLFLHTIKYDIPGYIIVKSLDLIKDQEITNDVIKTTVSGKLVPVVHGQIVFDLYSILSKLDSQEKPNEK